MKELLLTLNEWWENEKISEEKAKSYRRKIFEEIKNAYFGYRQIIILSGLRRVGKTTLMFQLIQEILKKGTDPRKILYFSFDARVEDIFKILEEYSKITKVDWKKENVYLFFDEIHKLKDWSNKLKILYDNLPNLRICVSGSASIEIEKEAIKNLAGRFFCYEIKPLNLQEYAELYYKKEIKDFEIFEDELKAIFSDYVSKPFPEIVEWSDKEKINWYIRELVVEKIIKSDIPEVFENVDVSLLTRLMNIFLSSPGMIIDLSSLAKELRVSKLTLSRHLYYLQFSKLIRIVKNYRPSIKAESRKLQKVYPFHPCFCFAFYSSVSEDKLLEGLVASSLELKNYWRKNSKEVDFVEVNKQMVPIEVKNKENVDREDLKNISYFLKRYRCKKGILVYKGEEKKQNEILLFPIYKLAFYNKI